ncbi:MAG: hypothetical protein HN389_11040 [Clostridia bacterium]|nr:hypothetical protein [Clostridia bacterium]
MNKKRLIAILLVIVMVLAIMPTNALAYSTRHLTMAVVTDGDHTDSSGGSVTPSSGDYRRNRYRQVTATANTDYVFDKWSSNVVKGWDGKYYVYMDSNKTVSAYFKSTAPTTYKLTVNTSGNGSVTKNPNKTEFNLDGSESVDLTAVADPGWAFAGWSGDLSGSTASQTLAMDGNKSVTAVFDRIPAFEINPSSIDNNENVTVTYGGNTYHFNEHSSSLTIPITSGQVVFTAAHDNTVKYRFHSWERPSGWGSAYPKSFTPTDGASYRIDPKFVVKSKKRLTVNEVPNAGGNVAKTSPNAPGGKYYKGTQVTLTATVASGYSGVTWSGVDSVDSGNPNIAYVTMNSNKTVTATFGYEEYEVTFVAGNNMTITGTNPVMTVDHDVTAPTFDLDAGYTFNGWDRSLNNITGPTTITANPCTIEYNLSLSSTSGGHLNNEGGVEGAYTAGVTVNLANAQPHANSGWAFAGWIDDATSTNIGKTPTITMDADRSYTAKFVDIEYMNTDAASNGYLANDLDGMVVKGDLVNLNDAQPTGNTGYELKYWREFNFNGWEEFGGYGKLVPLVGGQPIVTIDDLNFFKAYFELKDYTVTFVDSQGQTLGTETVTHGGNITKTKDSFTYDAGERPIGDGFAASEGQNITGNKTITVATEYKVTIVIGTCTLDSGSLSQWVAHSGDAAEPGVTPPTGHHWDSPKWDASFTGITAATTITAQYEINTYEVSFIDQNGAPYSTPQTIDHGSDAAKPALDDAVNTQFDASKTSWEAELLNITSDTQITVALDYLVAFNYTPGSSTDPKVSQFVAWGDDAVEPVVAPPTGHHWDTPAWDTAFTNVTAPVVAQAQYEINVYTVSFEDSQGEALGTEEVAHGSDVTKVAGDFTYDAGERPIGDGWAAVDGQNITAAKTIVVNTEYEVTFDENGGTVNSGDLTQWIAYDADATEPDVSPITGYHWDDPKWDTVFTNVTASLTTIAQFEINTYQVSFIDQNGAAYSAPQTIEHGSDALKPALDDPIGSQYDAAITAWESELVNVTEAREITVALEYLVTFDVTPGSSSDSNVSQFVAWGADATAPVVTPPSGHHLDDPAWDTPITGIIAPTSTKAIYEINVYTVSFFDFDDTPLGTDRVTWGDGAQPPVIPERDGHTFMGWSESIDPITGTLSVTAEYEIKTYVVKFVDHDGSAIGSSQTVDWNSAASAPADPERDGHEFTGWDKAFDHVKQNLTVTALYDEVAEDPEPEPSAEPTVEPADKAPETETLGDAALPQSAWWAQGGAFPWWWIVVIFGGLLGLFLLWWFLFWKRRKEEEEAA